MHDERFFPQLDINWFYLKFELFKSIGKKNERLNK
tara:strand:- start:866 stop:970 length:105 start_codon:yes stop_codon:yes gene_type:complete